MTERENIIASPDALLHLVLDNLPALASLLASDYTCRYANRQHFNWFGLEPAALAGQSYPDILGREAWARLQPVFDDARTSGNSTHLGELQFSRGGRRYVHCTAVSLETSAAPGLLLLATDLTEHRLIERALDASTRRDRSITDTAVDGIITIDSNGIVHSFNPGAERQFGFSAAEVIGRNVNMLMPMADARAHDGYLRRYQETGERHIIGIGREVMARHRDGSEFPVDLAVGEFLQDGQRFFTGFTRDISARKAAETTARKRLDELAEVARRASMGEFAASFAHEINQPLTAIVTTAQAMMRNLGSGRSSAESLQQGLEMIARQGIRTSTIVQQMREFVGKSKPAHRAPLWPDELVRDTLRLVDHEVSRHGIIVRCAFHDGPERVLADRIQLEQVLFNLIQNAIQAMADVDTGRTLVVGTALARDRPGFLEISVADNGCGLPEEELRIFEPFFTTREHGMGQGLSLSRSIVESHDGTIRAQRNAGAGSTFIVALPVARVAEA